MVRTKETQQIIRKYKERLERELGTLPTHYSIKSKDYETFRTQFAKKKHTWYEKACRFTENIAKIQPDKKKLPELEESLRVAHLQVTPTGATSFALLAPLVIIFIGVLLSTVGSMILTGEMSLFFVFFFVITGVALIYPLLNIPKFWANNWRLRASNEMVLCIFYVVTYMRHTSNLENALLFASQHLNGPLALDLKKVLWDVESGKYSTVKESLDLYLESWRQYNIEFIESFHLIESSLYEPTETRRIQLLDKSLDVILEETYEKMLHYAQNLKSPLTVLHMLGIILPILGMVILPLVVAFLTDKDTGLPLIQWYHLAAVYNVVLPLGVYYLGKTILAQRPTGYGDTDMSEDIPELKKYRNVLIHIGKKEFQVPPLYIAGSIGVVLFVLALVPVLFHAFGVPDIMLLETFSFLDYRVVSGVEMGPYGVGATAFSLFFPLAFAFGFGIYFRLRSQNVIKIRERTKKLEQEFASALFQLGNRLEDGLPSEIAIAKVGKVMEGTASGRFFNLVTTNIQKLGMNVDEAIFNSRVGALTQFPSRMISSSMKVLSQAAKKGPKIAGKAVINISRYIKELHRVNERLKDLLAEIISSMKSQIHMMTPAIAGIVVGITSMITSIMGALGERALSDDTVSIPGGFNPQDFFGGGIPTYYFQIVIGIYVVQIVYILTVLVNGIENGNDKLNERFLLGKNLIRSTTVYVVIAFIITFVFNYVAVTVLETTL